MLEGGPHAAAFRDRLTGMLGRYLCVQGLDYPFPPHFAHDGSVVMLGLAIDILGVDGGVV
jgi:hypothetical protein